MTIMNELCESLGGGKIINSMDELFNKYNKFIVFGASTAGKKTVEYLHSKKCDVLFYCDNDINKQGKYIDDLLVISPNDLLKYHDVPVAIGSCFAFDIAKQLRSISTNIAYFDVFGIALMLSKEYEYAKFYIENASEIDLIFNRLADDESRAILKSTIAYRLTMDPLLLRISEYRTYFHPLVRPRNGYVIIDAGAWEGDTASEFVDEIMKTRLNSTPETSKIFSFEPFPHSFSKLSELSKNYCDEVIKPMPYALGSHTHTAFMKFVEESEMNLAITMNMTVHDCQDSKNTQMIFVKTVDELFFEKGLHVNLIKMDIEGSEVDALHGARQTIMNDLPDLQVAVYHKPDDIFQIPRLINEFSNKYSFYIGHHGDDIADTILYATATR